MAQRDLTLVLRARDEAAKALATFSGQVDQAGRKAQALGAKLSIGLTAPLSILGGASIRAASDLSESLNKMKVVFGESSQAVEEFSKTAATSIGLSKQAAAEAAGTFGNLFLATGTSQQAAGEMSTTMLKLAADLASFNNIGIDEALEKLRSGLVGEAEPMRALGVLLSETAMKAKAAELGLGGVGRELTEAEKVQARYAIILAQTTTAQGDFTNTANGLANSTRIAKAQFADLQAELGEQLLPIAIKVVTTAKDLLGVFSSLSPEVKTAVIVFSGFLAIIGPLTAVVGTATRAIAFFTSAKTASTVAAVASTVAHSALAAAQAVATAAQWALNAALTANPIGIVIVALAALTAGIIWAWNNVDWFREALTNAWHFIQDNLIPLLQFLPGPFGVVIAVISHATDITNGLFGAINGVIGAIGGLLDAIGRIPSSISLPSIPSLPDIGGFLGDLPGFAAGGVVPGAIGAPTLAMVHGGETIIPPGRGGAGVIWTGNVIVQGSVTAERDLAETIRRELLLVKQRNVNTGL